MEINIEDEGTHIRVSAEVFAWLVSKKIHPRQSFNEVLEDIKQKEVMDDGL